ncbi:hypothetical protein N9M16_04955 [Candidatus Dependentiae bacterium]|nr:hypothetical protein [Candidatus Dependentiae bacterium]
MQTVAEGRIWTELDMNTQTICDNSISTAEREFLKNIYFEGGDDSACISRAGAPQSSVAPGNTPTENIKYVGFGNTAGVSPHRKEGSNVILGHLSGGLNLLTQHFGLVSVRAGLVEDTVSEQLVDIEQLKDRAASAARASVGFGQRTWTGLRDMLQSTVDRMQLLSEQDHLAAAAEITKEPVTGSESQASQDKYAHAHRSGSVTHESPRSISIRSQGGADTDNRRNTHILKQQSRDGLIIVKNVAACDAGGLRNRPYDWTNVDDDEWGDDEWGI